MNHRLKMPDWLSLYPRGTDASMLTDIVVTHAREKLAELRVSKAAAVSAPLELVQFDDVQDDRIGDAPIIPPIDEDAPTAAQTAHGAKCVWGAPSLRSAQDTAIPRLHTIYLTCVDWGRKYTPVIEEGDLLTWGGESYSHIQWSGASEFRQRYITMEYNGSGEIKAKLLTRVLNHLVDDVGSCA